MCKEASLYLESLFQLKKSMLNCSRKQRNLIWIEYYKRSTNDGYIIANLPKYLSLIHPDFYYKGGVSFKNNIQWEKKASFSNGISGTDRCQAHLNTGIECIFNTMPELRGKCHADHVWPNSLGGPSVLDNRMILCQFHNAMKSNDSKQQLPVIVTSPEDIVKTGSFYFLIHSSNSKYINYYSTIIFTMHKKVTVLIRIKCALLFF